ncbi:MAG TPA: hypothetical protein VLA51_13400, partial [Paracoccaceae bacterium]|nr:hypothetical protein [Paracoccaceae bacterium]
MAIDELCRRKKLFSELRVEFAAFHWPAKRKRGFGAPCCGQAAANLQGGFARTRLEFDQRGAAGNDVV